MHSDLHLLLQAQPTAVALPAEGVASDQAEPKVTGTEMVDTLLADSKQQVNHFVLEKVCADSTGCFWNKHHCCVG